MLLYDFSNFQTEFVLIIYCGQVNYVSIGGDCYNELIAGIIGIDLAIVTSRKTYHLGSHKWTMLNTVLIVTVIF
jgi:hypothetical protein